MNFILIPILMNKFYYFTLNYYYTYTSEVNKKFDILPSSTLISMYLLVYDLIIWLIKRIISLLTIHYYFLSLIIIQIISSFIPSLIVVLYVILGLLYNSSLCKIIYCEFRCFLFERLSNFLYCLFTFVFCCGGFWFEEDAPSLCSCECCCCDSLSCWYCEYFDNI